MLYIVGTPIGNLEDISLRALSTLKKCNYILCEDTRRTSKLLNHYQITNRLISYHLHNEKRKAKSIIDDLKNGMEVAIVSDAGMPTIADPGCELISLCHDENIKVTSIPGPSAIITALALSGLDGSRFQFVGFIPKKPSKIKKLIDEAIAFEGTTILFETPHRIIKTLKYFPENQIIIIARELTKIHEEIIKGSMEDIKSHMENNKSSVKGEFVILLNTSINK